MTKFELKCIFLIILIFSAACIETDIYLPAFPDMMNYFGVTEAEIQRLLTWNFIGICLSGPFYGPLSDSFGRKKPLLLALGSFFVGSLVTVFAQSYGSMLFGRLLQGIGSGGCFTLGTAILFDLFTKEKAISAVNKCNVIIPFIMAGAPMLGGYLNYSFGFRSNFLAITFFVLISLGVAVFFLDESLTKEKRIAFRSKKVLNDFKTVFKSAPFWQMTLVMSFLFAGYLVFLSMTSVLFVLEFGVSKKAFPFFQGALLAAWLIASLMTDRVIEKYGVLKMKRVGVSLISLSAVLLALFSLLTPQNPYLLTLPMVVNCFGFNWLMGIYFPEGMELHPDIKGVTASLLTSARLLMTAIIVGLGSAFYNGTIYPVSILIVSMIALTLPTIYFYERRMKESRPLLSAID